jgi:hypothetical protein
MIRARDGRDSDGGHFESGQFLYAKSFWIFGAEIPQRDPQTNKRDGLFFQYKKSKSAPLCGVASQQASALFGSHADTKAPQPRMTVLVKHEL